jgi:ArsR family transcriptional regulator, arsenate/arsenite/antimonite-responsive transcriptional repressor
MVAGCIDSCQYGQMVTTPASRTALPLADDCASAPGQDLAADAAEVYATVLKALADPVRLRLMVRLATSPDEVCVCDFPDVGVSQPTVSHHLRKLREAGLVECERRGTWVYYRAVTGPIGELARFLGGLSGPEPG